MIDCVDEAPASQAAYEGSIPFARSNNFNELDNDLLPETKLGSAWEAGKTGFRIAKCPLMTQSGVLCAGGRQNWCKQIVGCRETAKLMKAKRMERLAVCSREIITYDDRHVQRLGHCFDPAD